MFNGVTFQFSPEGISQQLYSQIYGNMQLTVLVGPNGSGKTTLMSFMAHVFHYAEKLKRYRVRAPGDFEINYALRLASTNQHIKIRCIDKELFVTTPTAAEKLVLPSGIAPRTRKKQQTRYPDATIEYSDFRRYLPTNVIVSAFSVHGEYPVADYSRYKTDQIVKTYNISAMYGTNHYGIGSLSRGIARLASLALKSASEELTLLERLLDIKLTGRVLINPTLELQEKARIYGDLRERYGYGSIPDNRRTDFDAALNQAYTSIYPWFPETPSTCWVRIGESMLNAEKDGDIYINDIELIRGGVRLSLGTMSAGEKMFFIRILSILSSIDDNSLIIMEEPELHLDPAWTKQIITVLIAFFSHYHAHFIVATHSFSFINAVFPQNIIALDRGGIIGNPQIQTFLANEAEISGGLFASSAEPNLLEEIIYEKARNANAKELRELLSDLGESHIRFAVFRKLRDVEKGK